MNDDVMYKERMLIEFEELVTRIANAKKHIEGVKTCEEDELLTRQIQAMEEYKRILGVRILKEMGRYDASNSK